MKGRTIPNNALISRRTHDTATTMGNLRLDSRRFGGRPSKRGRPTFPTLGPFLEPRGRPRGLLSGAFVAMWKPEKVCDAVSCICRLVKWGKKRRENTGQALNPSVMMPKRVLRCLAELHLFVCIYVDFQTQLCRIRAPSIV
jgi:hypothetical protein